ncbi:MAG: hypothetical protein U5L45_18525 [Saprospiraceae bacterium]|nr:hypothetical protein [Saprospiraceae bacterium]
MVRFSASPKNEPRLLPFARAKRARETFKCLKLKLNRANLKIKWTRCTSTFLKNYPTFVHLFHHQANFS